MALERPTGGMKGGDAEEVDHTHYSLGVLPGFFLFAHLTLVKLCNFIELVFLVWKTKIIQTLARAIMRIKM